MKQDVAKDEIPGKRRKKKRRRRRMTPFGLVLTGVMTLSLGVLGVGAYRLIALDRTIDGGAARVRSELRKETGEDAGPVPATAVQERGLGDAVGLLTFQGDDRAAVPVYYGTDAGVLEKGAGQAEETAKLNGPGNAVLFGHRDSAFRALAELSTGDVFTLETAEDTTQYAVRRIYITDPEDPHIYDTAEETLLTLVTCYPFAFVGPAPERYVVVATPVKNTQT